MADQKSTPEGTEPRPAETGEHAGAEPTGQPKQRRADELRELRAAVTAQAEQIAALQAQVEGLVGVQARLAEAIRRPDLLSPPATFEQVEAALKDPDGELLVLRDYKIGAMSIKANARLEVVNVDHRKILDGVAAGDLVVSIIKKPKPEKA